jgi:CRISPR-associated protein Cas8a1/Csx13
MAKVATEYPKTLTMNLFAPGMSMLHRAGLGGLACSLRAIERDVQKKKLPENRRPGGKWANGQPPWNITENSITLDFGEPESAASYLQTLFEYSFDLKEDLFFLPGQYGNLVPSHPVRAYLQQGITLTFLQHGLTRKLAKNETVLTFNPEEDSSKALQYQFKGCTEYKHQKGWKDITDSKGRLERNPVEIAGPLSPGAVVRHNAFSTPTKLYDLPAQILPLYFAIVGCLPLAINRGSGVLLIPDVTDLMVFPAIRAAMTPKTTRECQITIASDAALQTQLRLRATEEINKLELPACHVVTFQPTPWASQQKSRVDAITVEPGSDEVLSQFSVAMKELSPRIATREIEESSGKGMQKVVTKRSESFWVDSIVRPLVATNLARGRPWYHNFVELMVKIDPVSKRPLRDKLFFEKKGLSAMVEKVPWSDSGESTIVNAVHESIGRRYGLISKENKGNSTAMKNRWKGEYDRWRLAFAGAKTSEQFRRSLCDLFSRAGVNSVLQENWTNILPMLSDNRWQQARDLALLGLASYSGKGAKEIEEAIVTDGDPQTED